MKKEPQIGIRVGVPAFFALELENVYRHAEGAHRALAFPDFVGLLVGMGLEAYRKGNQITDTTLQVTAQGIEDEESTNPENLLEPFGEFDEANYHRRGWRYCRLNQ